MEETGSVNGDEISVTAPQDEGRSNHANRAPLLLLVGSAHEAGFTEAPRLLPLSDGLEIGRARAGAGTVLEGGRRLNLRDKLLSRNHVRILRTPRGYEVEDAGSLNGTFMSG